jgi:hypothetical protein
LEGLISLADVKEGIIDIDDINKLNALLNMRAAQEKQAMDRARNTK